MWYKCLSVFIFLRLSGNCLEIQLFFFFFFAWLREIVSRKGQSILGSCFCALFTYCSMQRWQVSFGQTGNIFVFVELTEIEEGEEPVHTFDVWTIPLVVSKEHSVYWRFSESCILFFFFACKISSSKLRWKKKKSSLHVVYGINFSYTLSKSSFVVEERMHFPTQVWCWN